MIKIMPYNTHFWSNTPIYPQQLSKNERVDLVIVGGGMAGLSAAYHAQELGLKVALCEQYNCGSGATGKSSGFITENAELYFTDFANKLGLSAAKTVWNMISQGVEDIRTNITTFDLNCGYSLENTLVVATKPKDFVTLQKEYKGLQSNKHEMLIYTQEQLPTILGTNSFHGGIVYEHTFGINAYEYCQEFKKVLQNKGVAIYEETPVTSIQENSITTNTYKIDAEHIIIATDRFLPNLGYFKEAIYHAQTFIMVSAPLTPAEQMAIFPNDRYMVWDTELIYNYFRITPDHRLILGGSDFFSTYFDEKYNYQRITKKLTNYFKRHFPKVQPHFQYQWPGLIGLSKDIMPLAGRDKTYKNHFYIGAAMGLPIAAGLGRYGVEHLFKGRDDLDAYFNPYRKFPLSGITQKLLGTKLSFALSNLLQQNIP